MNEPASSLPELSRLAFRLGLGACARVVSYRLLKKAGFYALALRSLPQQRISFRGDLLAAPLADPRIDTAALSQRAQEVGDGTFRLYEHHKVKLPPSPQWDLDPLTGRTLSGSRRHWSRIPFFPNEQVDIKNVWELSRWHWLTDLARHIRMSHDQSSWNRLHQLFNSWQESNPPYQGPHWMCGQETSIRLMNFLLATFIINEWRDSSKPLQELILNHLRRIALTLPYARAQANNHTVTEAAGLFLGGAVLHAMQDEDSRSEGLRFRVKGQQLLEQAALYLIERDGSFSQRSTNYHRLLLDTLSISVWAQQRLQAPAFSARFLERFRSAFDWLYEMVDPLSGQAPNLGGNDGSLLFSLTSCDFTDYRPSLQLAASQIGYSPPFTAGPWDEAAAWLGIPPKANGFRLERSSCTRSEGGYVVLRPHARSWALFHVPRFRFRPAHADLLHLDLWHDGVNLLRDSGTFSYHPPPDSRVSLEGTCAHNTIAFDGQDQMPRVSRFLFARWTNCCIIEPLSVENGICHIAAHYRDARGRTHTRRITASASEWVVEDRLEGSFDEACLSWHLSEGDWSLQGNRASSARAVITITGLDSNSIISLSQSPCSRYYQEALLLPCLRCQIRGASTITTTISLS